MKGVIYKYTSPNGKVYIGQTCREHGRRNDFRENVSYGGSRIDNARAKYGAMNFDYEVLFSIESDDLEEIQNVLNEKEQFYIEQYRSNDDRYGYNMSNGGAGNVGYEMPEESRKKIGANSRRWIAEKGHPLKGKKHSKESIEKMRKNTKKKFGKDNPNYGWQPPLELIERLNEMSRQRVGEKNPFFGRHHTEENKSAARKRYGRRVRQYDANTFAFLAEYESARYAAVQLGFSGKRGSDISKVCNGYIRKDGVQIITALGYRWKWADDNTELFATARVAPPPSFKGYKLKDEQKALISKINSKSVKQIDLTTGEVIAVHKSATAAAKSLGHPRSNSDIGKMCNGKLPPNKRHVLGFVWEWL